MKRTVAVGCFLVVVGLSACGEAAPDLDAMVVDLGLEPVEASVDADPALVELGQALFYDPILSGNRNISCATCHHPRFASGDGLSVSIGQGGVGVGTDRTMVDAMLIPRNATELFNRGGDEWHVMFWDGRVSGNPEEGFVTPAGDQLPSGLDSVLAAQAMFPVASAGEMRGNPEDEEIFGAPNEIGEFGDEEYTEIWAALTKRLTAIDGYVDLFAAAYPEVPVDGIGFEHAANALGAYQATAFDLTASPWNAYLGGDTGSLDSDAAAGALLFFGEAGCASCHVAPLLTDQAFHSLGVPQIGPGKDEEAPEDHGRGRETGDEGDAYAFRTPSLLNVSVSGPWMHDGAFSDLASVIRHHMDPVASYESYTVDQAVGPSLQFVDRARYREPLLASVSPELDVVPNLSDAEIDELIAFLGALTDPAATDLDALVPAEVPSGLPVDP